MPAGPDLARSFPLSGRSLLTTPSPASGTRAAAARGFFPQGFHSRTQSHERLLQAELGCVCWVLTPHPELPAAGELTAGRTCVQVCAGGRPAESLFHMPPRQSMNFRPRHVVLPPGDPRLLLAGPPPRPSVALSTPSRVGSELGNRSMPQTTGASWRGGAGRPTWRPRQQTPGCAETWLDLQSPLSTLRDLCSPTLSVMTFSVARKPHTPRPRTRGCPCFCDAGHGLCLYLEAGPHAGSGVACIPARPSPTFGSRASFSGPGSLHQFPSHSSACVSPWFTPGSW